MSARLPAYGKQLIAQRQAGHVPRNGVYIVFDWNLARAFPRIIITDDLPIEDIDLRCLAGLDCTLAYREKDASRVPEFSQAILNAQPRILNALAVDIPQNTILKNSAGEVFL